MTECTQTKKLILHRLVDSYEERYGQNSRKALPAAFRLMELLRESGDQEELLCLDTKYRCFSNSAVELSAAALEWCYIGQPVIAENLFRRAIGIEQRTLPPNSPKHPHRLFNMTISLLMQEKLEDAKKALSKAWQYQTDGHDIISARLLIERIAVAMLEQMPYRTYLSQIKPLLNVPKREFKENINPVTHAATFIDYLDDRFSRNERDLLHALFRAANDRKSVNELEACAVWKEVPPIKLEELDHVSI